MELLVVGPEAKLSDCPSDVMTVAVPLRVFDLVNTVRMMMGRDAQEPSRRGKVRSPEDERVIQKAKQLLMERNRLSEEAAHRYLQKRSMEAGRTMAESARMVLVLYENE